MTRTALIGHTGFVGGTLLRSRHYDDLYNSSNIGRIAGAKYDRLVCAGVSAAKWLANKDPASDRTGIARLTDALDKVEAREFILISTIDVYPVTSLALDEDAAIDASLNHSYGRHRYELEQWVRQRFPHAQIVRLPALFGNGLKKNLLYDLLHKCGVPTVHPEAQFQWYPMRRLNHDLERVRGAGAPLINLFPEGIAMAEITSAFFPDVEVGSAEGPAPVYGVRTKYASLFGGANGYMLDATVILGELARYIASSRRSARQAD